MLFRKKTTYTESDLPLLISACIRHDVHAQRSLVSMFYGFAKSVAMRYSNNIMETEEIVNDGFLRVFLHLEKYDVSQPFRAWLRTIIVNVAIDHFRKNRKHEWHDDVSELEIADLNEGVISSISADEIMQLIQKLTPSYRMVFTLYVIDGYNHREIAEMLGIKEGTSKSNLQDARLKLQAMILRNHPQLHLAWSTKRKVHGN
jgi:RNA polymerase sigma-70 factor (ECF subfamily)